MKVAWFRADAPDPANLLDDTAALVAELRRQHEIEVFTADNAHDFVWKHFREPYDLSVCELDNTPAHAFVWPYLLQYGGIALFRTLVLHDSRAAALFREGRMQDYAAEFAFNRGHSGVAPLDVTRRPHGHWPMLRAPLLASRLAVVPHQSTAATLRNAHPDAHVRTAVTGVQALPRAPETDHTRSVHGSPVRFGMLSTLRAAMIQRAMARACDAGALAVLLDDTAPARVLQEADVIVSMSWPWLGEPQTPALAAMAAGVPVIVLETIGSAGWPAFDPQTWRARGFSTEAPIVVSIDPRDEEHSLALAIRRLASDAPFRAELGGRAHAWWRVHATPARAAEDWERILSEAASLSPPARPPDWPPHLTGDTTAEARAVLEEFGAAVDFLSPSRPQP